MSTSTTRPLVGVLAYAIEVADAPLDRPRRDSIGGWPFLDEGEEWPTCFCDDRMVLFFQLDLPHDVEHFGGDHLLVFHCRQHNDATDPPTSDGRLAPAFWNAPQPPYPGPFWRVLLQRRPTPLAQREPSLHPVPLTLRPFADESNERGLGSQSFKVGGTPSWAQHPESYQCACGTELVYLCQVPEDMDFTTAPGAPEQPYSSSIDGYQLFLGNEVYLLACPARCDPAAIWPVNQN
ncbi:hypothetical protein [Streptomyces sp. NPDC048659]|uniref:hypothetical protein n=1 Tax=Streptomyces sp. NPDC048659 TaxID=3155489 RepID=UPI0034356E3A